MKREFATIATEYGDATVKAERAAEIAAEAEYHRGYVRLPV